MANSNTTVRQKGKDGGELTLSHNETDAPILPVAQIRALSEIAPGRVDWLFDQTEQEAQFRRKEIKRTNTFTFIEHMTALLLGPLFALAGGVATYLLYSTGDLEAAKRAGFGTGIVVVASLLAALIRRRR